MNTLLKDVQLALRQLRRSPGFVATAVLTLALGIGATTAIFTLAYQVLLRAIPVAHPEQLYKVGRVNACCDTGGLEGDWSLFSYDLYTDLRQQTPGTSGMAAVGAGATTVSARLAGTDQAGTDRAETDARKGVVREKVSSDKAFAQPLDVRFVSGNYFSLLGVSPYAGRMLRDEDDQQGAAPSAVIGYTLWQSKFAGAPGLPGSTLMLAGHPFTIVGIAAASFSGERNAQNAAGLWVPLAQEPTLEPERRLMKLPAVHWLDLLTRIPDPSQVSHVQLAIQAGLHHWIAAHGEAYDHSTPKQLAQQTTELVSASGGINTLRDQYEKSLKLLLLVAGFVLLIACANLANLMLVRGMARAQEVAVRSALGASRSRLVRQILVESLLLSLGGGAVAVLFAYAGTRSILAVAMRGVSLSPLSARPSLPVLAFAFVVAMVTGIGFGVAPAWITSRANPVDSLRGANRSTRDRSARPQRLLVILQAALSLVLLNTAGLLIASLRTLEHQNFHFQPDGRLLVFLDMQAAGYKVEQLPQLYRRMDDQFVQLPNVLSFAYATYAPMAYSNWSGGLFFPGGGAAAPAHASYSVASSHYFETIGTRVLLGRGFTEQDTATSPHVAVINQTLARNHFQGRNPVGQRFGPSMQLANEFEIVGVVEDTKYGDPSQPPTDMYFTPITQHVTWTKQEDVTDENYKHYANNLVVHVRGDQAAAALSVRQALQVIDPDIPIIRILSYADQLGDNFTQEELVVRLTTLFGALALALASVGLYGVTAYGVARRTSEIGIRMALGASRGGVLTMIVRKALAQACLGLLVGLPLCLAASRLLQHTLYQTSSFQPLVLLAVSALLIASAFLAAILPARRAASIDPMLALRAE